MSSGEFRSSTSGVGEAVRLRLSVSALVHARKFARVDGSTVSLWSAVVQRQCSALSIVSGTRRGAVGSAESGTAKWRWEETPQGEGDWSLDDCISEAKHGERTGSSERSCSPSVRCHSRLRMCAV